MWNSGPMADAGQLVAVPPPIPPPLVTIEELLERHDLPCGIPGPHFSRCMRGNAHPAGCAALYTDSTGVPIIVYWWPIGRIPTGPTS